MHQKSLFLLVIIAGSMILAAPLQAQQARKDTTRAAKTDSTEVLDEAELEKELARELGLLAGSETDTSATPPQPSAPAISGSVARAGSVLNPRISVIGTFFGSGTGNQAVARAVDVGLSEAEFSFQAYVDPYTKADFFVAFGREQEDPFAGPDEEAANLSEYEAELEEGYLTTLSLPFSLQIKAGKFLGAFGKLNSLHPHAFNFVDYPRMYVNYLGEEGLIDRGLSINWLVPNPFDLYQELTLETTSGALGGPAFQGNSKDLLYLLHLKNFFDLNDNTTLELGFTGMQGPNGLERYKTRMGAVDVTLRWKPLRMNRYKSFELMIEALASRYETGAGIVSSKALFAFLRYQLARRWFLGARYDYSEFPDDSKHNEKAYSAILSFYTSEFQKMELQVQHGIPAWGDAFNRILLRVVFVIGAHGVHKY